MSVISPTSIPRYFAPQLEADLQKKMVFLAGPRQCGKTYFAQQLVKQKKGTYLNWDDAEDRELLFNSRLPTGTPLLALDEVHKYRLWRGLVKGYYDKWGVKTDAGIEILVTGSAKLDLYRRGGDSLQGRYHLLRAHPFTLAELGDNHLSTLRDLLAYGPFPEPFLGRSATEAKRWSRDYRTRLIREEVASLERVSELSLLENLLVRLPECVGSPLSINSFREDLQVSHATLTRWVGLLENLYAIFRILPFGSPRIRAVKKEAKHYHFDWNLITERGPRFENLVASHLLKWCQWREDSEGAEIELRYFKDNEKREVDFIVTEDRKPTLLIEVKLSDTATSPSLRYLKRKFPSARALQLILEKDIDVTDAEGIRICNARHFLKELI